MTTVQSVYPRWLRQRVALTGALRLGDASALPVHIVDLSAGGAFCETDHRAHAGGPAQLSLDLPDGALNLEAVVTRSGTALRGALHPELDGLVVRAPGIGLRFVSLRAAGRERLLAYLTAVREG